MMNIEEPEKKGSIENELGRNNDTFRSPSLMSPFSRDEDQGFLDFYAYNSGKSLLSSPFLSSTWEPKFDHNHSRFFDSSIKSNSSQLSLEKFKSDEQSSNRFSEGKDDILCLKSEPSFTKNVSLEEFEKEIDQGSSELNHQTHPGGLEGCQQQGHSGCCPENLNCELATQPETEAAPSCTEPVVIKVTREAQFELFCDYNERDPNIDLAQGLLMPEDKGYCTCQKNRCLKMYCPCFRKGVVCGALCKCIGCENKLINKDKVTEIREIKLSQTKSYVISSIDEVCCHCKGSFCQKAYCPCYKNKKGCGPNCKCFNCKNKYGAKKR